MKKKLQLVLSKFLKLGGYRFKLCNFLYDVVFVLDVD